MYNITSHLLHSPVTYFAGQTPLHLFVHWCWCIPEPCVFSLYIFCLEHSQTLFPDTLGLNFSLRFSSTPLSLALITDCERRHGRPKAKHTYPGSS